MSITTHRISWETSDLASQIRIAVANIKVHKQNIEDNLDLKPNRSRERFQLFNLLNDICDSGVDLVVFPEVCVPHAWFRWLSWIATNRFVGIVIGLEHLVRDGRALNYVATILPYRSPLGFRTTYPWLRLKRHYAPAEVEEIQGRHLSVPPAGEQPYDLFKWRGASFTVFNCYELTNIVERGWFRGKVDFLAATELNRDISYFSNIAEASARDLHCYVVQSNDSGYGDSRIVAPAKSESMNLVRIKGGENETFLKVTLPLERLRYHQDKSAGYQLQHNDDFKPTPAGWSHEEVARRVEGARRQRNRDIESIEF